MKSLFLAMLFFSSNSFAQQIYTFECASEAAHIVVRVEAQEFKSAKNSVTAQVDIHSAAGTESASNALLSARSLSRSGQFSFNVGMGRSGAAQLAGNFRSQVGSFSVRTLSTQTSSQDAECRFFDGSGMAF